MIVAMQPIGQQMTTNQCLEGTRLFLWCVRRWVMLRFRSKDPVPLLKAALKQHRIEDAVSEIDALMNCIASHAKRRLHVGVTVGLEISDDEFVLLRALAAAERNLELTAALMDLLVDRTGNRATVARLQATSAAFRCASLDAHLLQADPVPNQPEIRERLPQLRVSS